MTPRCGLGIDQGVAGLFQHFLVDGAMRSAIVFDRRIDYVVHFGNQVDLALQFVTRLENDAPGIDVTLVFALVLTATPTVPHCHGTE